MRSATSLVVVVVGTNRRKGGWHAIRIRRDGKSKELSRCEAWKTRCRREWTSDWEEGQPNGGFLPSHGPVSTLLEREVSAGGVRDLLADLLVFFAVGHYGLGRCRVVLALLLVLLVVAVAVALLTVALAVEQVVPTKRKKGLGSLLTSGERCRIFIRLDANVGGRR